MRQPVTRGVTQKWATFLLVPLTRLNKIGTLKTPSRNDTRAVGNDHFCDATKKGHPPHQHKEGIPKSITKVVG